MTSDDELMTVYHAGNVTEAQLVANLLADEDIDARVADQNAPTLGIGLLAQVSVLVRRRDEQRAAAVVEAYEEHQIERAERPDWTCPACAATVLGAYDSCDQCNADRPPKADR